MIIEGINLLFLVFGKPQSKREGDVQMHKKCFTLVVLLAVFLSACATATPTAAPATEVPATPPPAAEATTLQI
jgi:hypothetical protein